MKTQGLHGIPNRDTRPEIMLGMMVSQGNIDQAETTATRFAQVVGKGSVLGIQTDDLIRGQVPLKGFVGKRQSEPWEGVYLWDKQCDDAWQSIWPPSLPRLFYTGKDIFSYGGAFNRLLVLALVAKAPVLVRVDAGTAPMNAPSFNASLGSHLALLDKYAVVSGGYSGRIALRDLKGLQGPELDEFRRLVRRHSSVDPYHQLTGGACFALRSESGPPAIAFPGVLPVWASDDAFFQSSAPSSFVNATDEDPDPNKNKVAPRDPMIIQRNDPGQPLTGPEYLARLTCAAALAAIYQKANRSLRDIPGLDTIVDAGVAFLDELRKSFPDAVRASHHGGALNRLHERALGLIEGYENYIELTACWGEVRDQIATIVASSLPFDIYH
jgi:hypothetical protein